MILAVCYRSGHIEFHPTKCPDGAIPLLKGPEDKLKDFMSGVARHAYDKETLLVPGLPEAKSEDEAFDALNKFLAWIKPQAKKHGLS